MVHFCHRREKRLQHKRCHDVQIIKRRDNQEKRFLDMAMDCKIGKYGKRRRRLN